VREDYFLSGPARSGATSKRSANSWASRSCNTWAHPNFADRSRHP